MPKSPLLNQTSRIADTEIDTELIIHLCFRYLIRWDIKGSKSLDRFKCKQQAVNETFIFVLAKEMKYFAYRHGLHTVMKSTSQSVATIRFSARALILF